MVAAATFCEIHIVLLVHGIRNAFTREESMRDNDVKQTIWDLPLHLKLFYAPI